ncbi:MAG TPA: hypothetical protein V6D15_11625 [Oculatellaceae cyanobacterium]|jgi:hypothetical protein
MGSAEMTIETNLKAEIIPFKSCGVITIGSSLSECTFLDDALWLKKPINADIDLVDSLGWVCERLLSKDGLVIVRTVCYYKNDIIMLCFNSKNILYFALMKKGFEGKVFGEIGIGSTLGELRRFVEFEYDSGDEAYYPSEKSEIIGIAFYTGLSPYSGVDDEELFILEGGDLDHLDDDQEIIMISIQDWSLNDRKIEM